MDFTWTEETLRQVGEDTNMLYEALLMKLPQEQALALTQHLAEQLGGARLYLASEEKVRTDMRRRRAVELLRQGLTAAEVRRQTGLSLSQVRRIRLEEEP